MGKISKGVRTWLGGKKSKPLASHSHYYSNPEHLREWQNTAHTVVKRTHLNAPPPYICNSPNCSPPPPQYSVAIGPPQDAQDTITTAIYMAWYITKREKSASGLALVSSGLSRVADAVAAVPPAHTAIFITNLTTAMTAIFDAMSDEKTLPFDTTFKPRDITEFSSFRPNFLDALWALPEGPCRTIFRREFPPIMYEIGILVFAQLYFLRKVHVPTFMSVVTAVAEGVAQVPPISKRDVATAYARFVWERAEEVAWSHVSTEVEQKPLGSPWTADDFLPGF